MASRPKSRDPENTHCLLIGAADWKPGDAKAMSVFSSVRDDLTKMTEYCAQWLQDKVAQPSHSFMVKSAGTRQGRPSTGVRTPIRISFLVSDKGLLPNSAHLKEKGKKLFAACGGTDVVYTNEADISKKICDAVTNPDPNIIIFYAGHGNQTSQISKARLQKPPGHPATVQLEIDNICHSLYFPVGDGTPIWYSDKQFTEDLSTAQGHQKRIYVVIHSCNSGGMFHPCQMPSASEPSVVLFASSDAENLSPWSVQEDGYVDLFTESAEPGQPVVEIQKLIFTACLKARHGRASGASPRLITSSPELANTPFL